MNTPDTPTPRTEDLDQKLVDFGWDEGYGEMINFARQLERELTAAKEELRMAVEVIDERAKERESLQAELALLRKRVEAADGLAEAAGCVVNRDAEYDRDKWVKDGAGWDSDMIELKHADAAYRATEGKKL